MILHSNRIETLEKGSRAIKSDADDLIKWRHEWTFFSEIDYDQVLRDIFVTY